MALLVLLDRQMPVVVHGMLPYLLHIGSTIDGSPSISLNTYK